MKRNFSHGTISPHHPHRGFFSTSFPAHSSFVKFFDKSVNATSRMFIVRNRRTKIIFFPTCARSLETLKNSLYTHLLTIHLSFPIHFHGLSFFLRKNYPKNMFTPSSITTCSTNKRSELFHLTHPKHPKFSSHLPTLSPIHFDTSPFLPR